MFKRNKHQDGGSGDRSGKRLRPGREESMRVLQAFLAEQPSGAAIPGSGPSAAPPPLAAGVPQASATSENPFVYHVTNLVGPENAPRGARYGNVSTPNFTFPIPGVGPVTADQLHQASARVTRC